MTLYTGIQGQRIQVLATDPTDPVEGQLWYNSTSSTLKGASFTAATPGAWSAGGNLGTARYSLTGAGTQTAGLAFGGRNDSFNPVNATEEYNGSSWTAGGNLSIPRNKIAGAGTQASGLGFGGYGISNNILNSTEEYTGGSPASITIQTITIS